MRYKKGQRFVDEKGGVLIQIISSTRRPTCGDSYCSMCNKYTYYQVECLHNKKRNAVWYKGKKKELTSDSLSSWSYLTGQDAPRN